VWYVSALSVDDRHNGLITLGCSTRNAHERRCGGQMLWLQFGVAAHLEAVGGLIRFTYIAVCFSLAVRWGGPCSARV
jgi:hypothetical protein